MFTIEFRVGLKRVTVADVHRIVPLLFQYMFIKNKIIAYTLELVVCVIEGMVLSILFLSDHDVSFFSIRNYYVAKSGCF